MPPYDYSSPALGSDSIRLLRLMPNADEAAPIQCKLCNYPLERSSQKTHLYEALSYVWGSSVKDHSVLIDGYDLAITANLHNALSRLRNHYFERIIWADSICINQEDEHEKEHQIQFMAKIYGQANCVIVYLGEAANDSDQALEDIRIAAEDPSEFFSINEKRQEAIFKLLRRPWFRRIWILQEVGVARRILIKCGSMEINGFPFCIGVNKLELAYGFHEDLQSLIGPVTYLIRGAIFRTKNTTFSSVGLPLCELLDMYHTHEATMRHDKLFALLGMSSDDINAAGLSPNYSIPWDTLWKRLVQFVLPKSTCFETWAEREMAVIKSKGFALGYITSIDRDSTGYGRQHIRVILNEAPKALEYKKKYGTQWTLQASAKSIQQNDIICLIQGASKPAILRPCKDYFLVIMITVNLTLKKNCDSDQKPLTKTRVVSREFLFVLNWGKLPRSLEDQDGRDDSSTQLNNIVPDYLKTASEKASKLYEVALVMADSQGHEAAEKGFENAAKKCEETFGKESPRTLACLEGLALSYMNMRYWEKATDLLLGLILTRKRVQGRNHQDTVNSIANLALTYLNHGNYKWQWQDLDRMENLLDRVRDNVQIPENDLIQVTIHPFREELMAALFELGRDKVQITTEVLRSGTEYGGKGMMTLLLDHCDTEVTINEEVIKAAARNELHPGSVMGLLLDYGGSRVSITEDVIKMALGNKYRSEEIISLLFDRRPDEIKITEEVLKAAAKNGFGSPETLSLLFDRRPHEIKITEECLKVVVATYAGPRVLSQLFDRCTYDIKITEDVLKAAVEFGRKEVLLVLFDRRPDEIKITEEVLKAAFLNQSYDSSDIISLLLDRRPDEIKITEELLDLAVRNYQGPSILRLLFDRRPDEIKITEDVLKAAVEFGSKEVLLVLFDRRPDEIKITEEVLKAAFRNETCYDCGVISLLLDRRPDEIKITEEVLKAAASNDSEGYGILKFIYDTFNITVTLGMIEAAATSGQETVLELFDEWSPIGSDRDRWFAIARLYNAACIGDAATARQLVIDGTPPDKQNIYGGTPLWRASANGKLDVVKILLATGVVNVNVQSISRRNPLFWAAAYGYSEIVRMLLDYGADPNYEDINGDSPMSMARNGGHKDVVAMLIEHQSTMQKSEDKKDEQELAKVEHEN